MDRRGELAGKWAYFIEPSGRSAGRVPATLWTMAILAFGEESFFFACDDLDIHCARGTGVYPAKTLAEARRAWRVVKEYEEREEAKRLVMRKERQRLRYRLRRDWERLQKEPPSKERDLAMRRIYNKWMQIHPELRAEMRAREAARRKRTRRKQSKPSKRSS
jgi:hypothetical protein